MQILSISRLKGKAKKENKGKQENTTLKTPKKLDSLQEHSMIHIHNKMCTGLNLKKKHMHECSHITKPVLGHKALTAIPSSLNS